MSTIIVMPSMIARAWLSLRANGAVVSLCTLTAWSITSRNNRARSTSARFETAPPVAGLDPPGVALEPEAGLDAPPLVGGRGGRFGFSDTPTPTKTGRGDEAG